MSAPERLLEEALTLTHRMVELARKDDWEVVQALEQKQGRLLRDCFESGIPFADRAGAAHQVQEILDLHQRIIALGAESQDRVKQELSQLQKSRTAIRAYLDNV